MTTALFLLTDRETKDSNVHCTFRDMTEMTLGHHILVAPVVREYMSYLFHKFDVSCTIGKT